MSTKSTIFVTGDYNEHWYKDCSEYLNSQGDQAISLEFDKRNIRIDTNDQDDLAITITNPDCELYKVLNRLNYLDKMNDLYKDFKRGKISIAKMMSELENIGESMKQDFLRQINRP